LDNIQEIVSFKPLLFLAEKDKDLKKFGNQLAEEFLEIEAMENSRTKW
jgi:hypothetical protein